MKIAKYSNLRDLPDTYLAWADHKDVSIFEKPGWFELLQKHIVTHDEQVIYYCVLNKNDVVEAVFPLIKCTNKTESGYILKSLANFYTMEYEPFYIKKARNCQKAISVFVKYLATEETGWATLELLPIDEEKLSSFYLKAELSKYFKVSSSFGHKNWIYRNNGEEFKDYIALSPSRVKDIRRKDRRLVKNHDVKFVMWADDTDIERCIQDYFTVYNDSWKDEEQYPDFIPDLIRLCGGEKTLRLGILYIDHMPTAVQFNIFHGNVTLIYKLSYHEKYKHLSAGAVLSLKMMEYAFDQDKSLEIDYGCGDDDYKKEWMTICRKKMIMTTYNNTIAGRYKYLKQSWKFRLKQFLFPE